MLGSFAEPEKNIEHFELQPGFSVADFGAGTGVYSLISARRVGSSGHVYAIEVQKELLERLKAEAKDRRVANLDVVWGDLDTLGGSGLKDASMDAVILSNILFQSDNRAAMIGEVSRVLKPGGKALFIDWLDSFGNLGPLASQVISEPSARKLFEGAGMKVQPMFSAGAHHYGFVAHKIEA